MDTSDFEIKLKPSFLRGGNVKNSWKEPFRLVTNDSQKVEIFVQLHKENVQHFTHSLAAAVRWTPNVQCRSENLNFWFMSQLEEYTMKFSISTKWKLQYHYSTIFSRTLQWTTIIPYRDLPYWQAHSSVGIRYHHPDDRQSIDAPSNHSELSTRLRPRGRKTLSSILKHPTASTCNFQNR